MELSLDSALSLGAFVGHLSYLLLVLSMMMRRIVALRVLAIASAVVGITYDVVWVNDPVGAFWETLLLLVNLGQLSLMHWEDRRATFSEEERAFVEACFPGLSSRLRRRLLDLGLWVSGEPGTVLTREGDSVERLLYLARGEARVSLGGVPVASCRAGSFIGEMTVLDQAPATGTVVLSAPSRFWAVDARVLRRAASAEPEIRSALSASFSSDLRSKLVAANRATAGGAEGEDGRN